MFSGIVEDMAIVKAIRESDNNINFVLSCSFVNELHIDQSISHNGICLTVVDMADDCYTVTAMYETLLRTNLRFLKVGSRVNVERSMLLGGRLDGHIVQGHVDTTARCISVEDAGGSKYFTFEIEERDVRGTPIGFSSEITDKLLVQSLYNARRQKGHIAVDKGSITVNGVSLTVCNPSFSTFQVSIIPYTMEFTNFGDLHVGCIVNIEFDILGKYIAALNP